MTGLVNALAKVWSQACDWEPVLPTSLRAGSGGRVPADPRRGPLHPTTSLTPGLQQIFGMAEGMLKFTRPGDPVEVRCTAIRN